MSTRAVSASACGYYWLVGAALFGALACSGSGAESSPDRQERSISAEVSACITGNPPPEPFDVGDVTPVSPAPMSGAAAPAPPTVETFAAECRAEGGTGCNESFISREAARCIAQDAGFTAGLEQWTIGLKYHHSYRRVVWGIENLLVDDRAAEGSAAGGGGGYSGESLTVDAVAGSVLGRTSWRAVQ